MRIALADFSGEEGRLVIYDNLGKVRLIQDFDEMIGDEMHLNLQEFTDGVYHVSLEANGKRAHTERLIVNRFNGWKVIER